MFGINAPLPPILGPTNQAPPAFVMHDHGAFAGSNFYATTAHAGAWLNSTDNSGTVRTVVANDFGVVRLLPGTSANDYVSIQFNSSPFSLAVGRRIILQARIRTNDADDIKFFFGLATIASGTSATAGPVLDGVTNSIGFRNVAGNTTAFLCVTEDDTTETTSTPSENGTLADDTWRTLTIEIDGTSRVNFYIDGKKVASHTTNLPDAGDALSLTFEVGSPTGTTATYLDWDYWLVAMDGQSAV